MEATCAYPLKQVGDSQLQEGRDCVSPFPLEQGTLGTRAGPSNLALRLRKSHGWWQLQIVTSVQVCRRAVC